MCFSGKTRAFLHFELFILRFPFGALISLHFPVGDLQSAFSLEISFTKQVLLLLLLLICFAYPAGRFFVHNESMLLSCFHISDEAILGTQRYFERTVKISAKQSIRNKR